MALVQDVLQLPSQDEGANQDHNKKEWINNAYSGAEHEEKGDDDKEAGDDEKEEFDDDKEEVDDEK